MFGFGGGSGFNAWTWIILILIVLQWFRVGFNGVGGVGGVPGVGEVGLMANGGLFIIAIFLLVACGCFRGPSYAPPIAPIRYC
jgi:hypothetical protein